MRIREKGYKDYFISEEEMKVIKDFCRKATKKQQEDIISTALSELDPYISRYIYISLVKGLSYEKIDGRYGLAIGKNDFYAYRRKAFDAINRWMMWFKEW